MRSKKITDNILPIIVAIIAVFMFVFIFARGINPTKPQTQDENSNPLQQDVKIFPVENNKEFQISSKTFTLTGSWFVNTKATYLNNKKFECTGNSTTFCTVYFLTNGEFEFYVSNVLFTDSTSSKATFRESEYSVNRNTTPIKFNALMYKEFTDVDGKLVEKQDSILFKEIYGCVTDGYCITTGKIDTDSSQNSKLVTAFSDLILNIKEK